MQKKEIIIDIVVLALIWLFLLSYFKPNLILSETTTAGGDTPSHVTTAKYLKENFIPKGRAVGWFPGAYGGMALLQFYFPLPFLMIVFLSYLVPLEIAFKIITILGIFILPLCAYFCFKLMKFKFPTPILASISTLAFLFVQSNTMWGGNIPSTLAGEFSYSIGLSFSILFFGFLFNGIKSRKFLIMNSILFFIIGITHIYTLILVSFGSLYFLLSKKDFVDNFKYLFKMFFVGGLLLGFWLVPLYAKLGYTTAFALTWIFSSFNEVLPTIVIPLILISLIGYLYARIKKFETDEFDYFFFIILISLVFFALATKLGFVDIRFLPFIQLFFCLMAAVSLDLFFKKLKLKMFVPIILFLVMVLWVQSNVTYIDGWIEWNYKGFEEKQTWQTYQEINNYFSGDVNDPRVVYEHSNKHNQFGTSRAFEMLPYFSGRSTLEGVYMQASLLGPFVFYVQSELSKEISCPFPNYGCTVIDIARARRHLEMFNVNEFIVISDEVKDALKNFPEFELEKTIAEYEIYEFTSNENRYVELLDYEPILFETKNAKFVSYLWFIDENINDVHLVFVDDVKEDDEDRFTQIVYDDSLDNISKVRVAADCSINESISDEEILIQTTCIGKPLLVKISVFPNWKVEGAEKIYYASPAFMLIFPEQENVRIYYGNTFSDYLGLSFSVIGAALLLLLLTEKDLKYKTKRLDRFLRSIYQYKNKILFLLFILAVILFIVDLQTNLIKSDEKLYMKEIAVTTGSYTVCDHSGAYRDDCLILVAEKTDDKNLCAVEVSKSRKEECYEKFL